jgi:hypothetical protein
MQAEQKKAPPASWLACLPSPDTKLKSYSKAFAGLGEQPIALALAEDAARFTKCEGFSQNS